MSEEEHSRTLSNRPVYAAPSPAVIILGTVVGGFLFFIWGMLSWMVFNLHGGTILRLKDDNAILTQLAKEELKTGWYTLPGMAQLPHADGTKMKFETKEEESAYDFAVMESVKKGPFVSILYHAEGFEMMGGRTLFGGLLIDFICAFCVCTVLYASLGTTILFWQRMLIIEMMVVFAACVHFQNYNWMAYPWDYTMAMVVDVVLGWTLVGIVLSLLFVPRVVRVENLDALTQTHSERKENPNYG